MSKPYFCAVIGKGFGDEGKGMAVDFLSQRHDKTLVIRHNGGAQSGHTVELPDKRFVFHELSSGSFRGADTMWAGTYFPDLYKLGEETDAFKALTGFVPVIYGEASVCVTIIDDVLVNMAAESARGEGRHGSCGMGIYEAQCRTEAGYGLTLKDLREMSPECLMKRLSDIREQYLPKRLTELMLQEKDLGEYGELLKSRTVLENAAREMLQNLKYIRIVDSTEERLDAYDCVIFENGQGLLLDAENEVYAPHVTASRTGLTNPCKMLKNMNRQLDEVVYVTRSYVTRHGAGPLLNECAKSVLGKVEEDRTNQTNDWQGSLRYAKHEMPELFVQTIRQDLQQIKEYELQMPMRTLLITHLNETHYKLVCRDRAYALEDFCQVPAVADTFDRVLTSETHFSEDIRSFD